MNKKTILYFLMIIGLGFAQEKEASPCITLSKPLSMYLGQPIDNKSSTQRIPRIPPTCPSTVTQTGRSANHLSSNYLSPNTILLQTEDDTLQPKTSFWKQTGIYGLEFVGAGVTTFSSYYLSFRIAGYPTGPPFGDPEYGWQWLKANGVYIILNTFTSSSATWLLGKVFNQKGSWVKAVIGTGVCSSLTVLTWYTLIGPPPAPGDPYGPYAKYSAWWTILSFSLPPTGSVIGYNWH